MQQEFDKGLKHYGINLPRDQVRQLASNYDLNKDGVISLPEFHRRMDQLLAKSAVTSKPEEARMLMASLVPQPQRRENVALARRPIANMTAAEVDRRLANKLFSKFRNVQAAVSWRVPPCCPPHAAPHPLTLCHESLSRVCVVSGASFACLTTITLAA